MKNLTTLAWTVSFLFNLFDAVLLMHSIVSAAEKVLN